MLASQSQGQLPRGQEELEQMGLQSQDEVHEQAVAPVQVPPKLLQCNPQLQLPALHPQG